MREVFAHAVQLVTKSQMTIVSGKAANITDTVFDLQIEEGADIKDVRIGAIASGTQTYIKIIPADNSTVLVGMIENSDTEAVLLATSEIDKIEIKAGALKVSLTGDKISLKNGQIDFKDFLSGLIDDLKSAVIQTPAGPGNFSPADVQKMTQRKQELLNLFE